MKKYSVDEVRTYLEEIVSSSMSRRDKFYILNENGVALSPDEPPLYYVEGDTATGFYMEGSKLCSETLPVSEIDAAFLVK